MTVSHRTQVAIIGAGPAGLLLGQLLHLAGIEAIIIESRSRDYVEHRIRAGVLEWTSVEVLKDAGVGARLEREGLTHEGIELRFDGRPHRIDFAELTGKTVTVYGQHEVVKDLIAARIEAGLPLLFEAEAVSVTGIDSDRPKVSFRHDGADQVIECDYVAGCDGFHGISRPAVAASTQMFDRVYPFAWLGILAEAAPATEELIYAAHDKGFALFSMRSPTITRLYLQCAPDEDLSKWSDERVWEELDARLGGEDGFAPTRGPIIQKSITPMRSFVAEPMRHDRLFLMGDAAHIVPPTGAKGMNLAVADVHAFCRALEDVYGKRGTTRLDAWSERQLARIWKVQRFSWWMTSILHRFDDHSPFDRRRQRAELDYLTSSRAAQTSLAENYVGLPLD